MKYTLISEPVIPPGGSTGSEGGNSTGSGNGGGGTSIGGNYSPTCNPNIAPGTSVGPNQALPCGTTYTPVTVLNINDFSVNSTVGKFVMSNADQAAYPRFTEMVKNIKSMVTNDPKIITGLKDWTGLSQDQILSHLTFGSGPSITIVHLDDQYGKFNVYEPNVVRIDKDYVLGLEKATFESTKKATSFLLAVTLLHEYVHFGSNLSKLEFNTEMGEGFENQVFGVTIDETNASNIFIKLYGRPK